MNPETAPASACPFCSGGSLLLERGGHDPACPLAQRIPVSARKPRPQTTEEFLCSDDPKAREQLRRRAHNAARRPAW